MSPKGTASKPGGPWDGLWESQAAPDPNEFNISIGCDTCGPLWSIVDVKRDRFIEYAARECLRLGHAITIRRL